MEKMNVLDHEFCNITCTADELYICGGPRGAISVYPNFPADSLDGVTVTAKNVMGRFVNGTEPEYHLLTGDEVYLNVSIGDFYCHAANPLTCSSGGGFLPPARIFVDYGDGSGQAEWTRENTQDLWRHAYVKAGTYNIAIVGGCSYFEYHLSITYWYILTIQMKYFFVSNGSV